jgi:hypothetical protein
MVRKLGDWSQLVIGLLGCCTASQGQNSTVPRYPKGIYVAVGPNDVSSLVSLLDNAAVSGLSVHGLLWTNLNPNPPISNPLPSPVDCSNVPTYNGSDPYNWTYTDAAFCAVDAWNKAHPQGVPKGIRFDPAPGYWTPQWVLDQINKETCNGQFVFEVQPYYIQSGESPPASLLPPYPASLSTSSSRSTCDLAYFLNWEDGGPTKNGVAYNWWMPLPMPWDSIYKSAWQAFLLAFNARYGQSPALVGIAVAGPTSSSTEVLLPGDIDNDPTGRANWRTLLASQYSSPAYHNSDQAFIDEWEAAIDAYAKIFSGIALIVTLANPGFPNFVIGGLTGPSGSTGLCGDATINSDWPTMSCLAQYSILSYFEESSSGGRNLKATQMSGLVASYGVNVPDVGIHGVRYITQSTAQSSRILGGAAFNTGVSGGNTAIEGCDGPFPPPGTYPCTVEQALYNVIRDFFEDTAAATSWGWGSKGAAPLDYLEIDAADITYANTHTTPVSILTAEGLIEDSTYPPDCDHPRRGPGPGNVSTTGPCVNEVRIRGASRAPMTAQDILNLASQGLAKTFEQPLPLPMSPN